MPWGLPLAVSSWAEHDSIVDKYGWVSDLVVRKEGSTEEIEGNNFYHLKRRGKGMKKIVLALLVVLLMSGNAMAMKCIQDQYGGQWNFNIDKTHQFLWGGLYVYALCPEVMYVSGSYVVTPGGVVLQLTASNSQGDFGLCRPEFTVKGTFPNAEWFYGDTGWGDQPFAFMPCGSPVSASPGGAGPFK